MKANRKIILEQDDRAQVGIGTMIVFIATILVAATAAAVLIDTSGKLSERSASTGNEATQQVASNLIVKGVYGVRPASTGNLEDLNFTIGLAPGAEPIDFAQVKILYSDGDNRVELDHASAHTVGGTNYFKPVEVRDPKSTFSASAPILSAGGLVNLEVDLNKAGGATDMTLATRGDITVMLIPEVGAPVHADFTSPNSYGTDNVVVLR